MADNRLTPEVDLATRRYYKIVENDDNLPKEVKRDIMGTLLRALNYIILPNGAFVESTTTRAVKFGSDDYSAYPCEWNDDTLRAEELWNAANDTQDTPETSTSVEGEGAEMGEAVLSKDV